MVEYNCRFGAGSAAKLKVQTNDPSRPLEDLELGGAYRTRRSLTSKLGNEPQSECQDVDSFAIPYKFSDYYKGATVDAVDPRQRKNRAVKLMAGNTDSQGEFIPLEIKVGVLPLTMDMSDSRSELKVVELTRSYWDQGTRIRPFRGEYTVSAVALGAVSTDPPKPLKDVE